MKLKVELDLTAKEAREMLGLPDIEPMQQRVMDKLEKKVMSGLDKLDAEAIVSGIASRVIPDTSTAIDAIDNVQKMFWDLAGRATSAARRSGSGAARPATPSEDVDAETVAKKPAARRKTGSAKRRTTS